MADKTGISWADATWNPVAGCQHVSDGCENCYAAREASGRLRHLPAYAGLATGGRFTGEVRLLPERLDKPYRWRKPRLIFVTSTSDLFHKGVPDQYIARVFAAMHDADWHIFQVLTKRPGRMRSLLSSDRFRDLLARELSASRGPDYRYTSDQPRWPLPNVWLGVSVENQHWASVRIPVLLDTPAVVRWVSAEPLLGPVSLHRWLRHGIPTRWITSQYPAEMAHFERAPGTPALDWVVAGGESGPRARPAHPQWFRDLRDQCGYAGAAFHFKQWGEFRPYTYGVLARQLRSVALDGTAYEPGDAASAGQRDLAAMYRVGKHFAGRDLDGQTWDEYPQVAAA